MSHHNALKPSLRAKRSNPWAAERGLDCFVAALLAMTWLVRSAKDLRTHRLDIVAVGIDQERGIVSRAVIGSRAGAGFVAAAGLHALGVEFLDRVMIFRAEGEVGAGSGRPLVQVKPQRRLALGPKTRAVFVFRAQDIAERRQ